MSVYEELDVDLGFVEKSEAWKLASKFFPSKIGGQPAWLDLKKLPGTKELLCHACLKPMTFLCQLYAPINNNDDCFHRTLFVFICCNGNCHSETESSYTKVFRSQLPRKNSFFSFEPPVEVKEDSYNPTAADYSTLCVVCGSLGPTPCDGCMSASYCSKDHQNVDWRAGHNKICQKDIIQRKCYAKGVNFTEFEIDMEVEEIDESSDSEEDRISDSESDDSLQQTDPETEQLSAMALVETDKQFSIFRKRINNYPDQVIRYQRGGIPLWASSENKLANIPLCTQCGGNMQFEFQVMPKLLVYLNTKEKILDWGTLLVYTCSKSCQIDGYVEEFVYKQDYKAKET